MIFELLEGSNEGRAVFRIDLRLYECYNLGLKDEALGLS